MKVSSDTFVLMKLSRVCWATQMYREHMCVTLPSAYRCEMSFKNVSNILSTVKLQLDEVTHSWVRSEFPFPSDPLEDLCELILPAALVCARLIGETAEKISARGWGAWCGGRRGSCCHRWVLAGQRCVYSGVIDMLDKPLHCLSHWHAKEERNDEKKRSPEWLYYG